MPATASGRHLTLIPPEGAAGLIGDATDWDRRPPLPVQPGKPLTLALPRNAWFEYAWVDAAGEPFADPAGLPTVNPWYTYARAAEVGRWAEHPLWQGPAPELGVTHRLHWDGEVFAGKRRAMLYLPRSYTAGEALPVYYVQDGVAFARVGRLAELLERAVAAGQARPAALVFVEPGDRNAEYYLNGDYFTFLQREVMPRIEGDLADWGEALRPSERGLWGASLGGLISLYLGSEHPELFSRVVSHSGAFIARPGARTPAGRIDLMTAGEWLRERLEAAPPRHLTVSLDTGLLEWLTAPNRRMAAALKDSSIDHQYREYAGGHNWVTWRQALAEALLYQLG